MAPAEQSIIRPYREEILVHDKTRVIPKDTELGERSRCKRTRRPGRTYPGTENTQVCGARRTKERWSLALGVGGVGSWCSVGTAVLGER